MTQNVIWLSSPAERWLDAFPIGNGRIGAMVFGGASEERLALNHESLWRGVTRNRTTQPVHQYLPEIREKLMAGEWIEGAELAKKHLSGHERRVEPYQPVGDLKIALTGHDAASDYRRRLDIADGIAEVSYRAGIGRFQREAFVSAEHGVMVLRLTADKPRALTAVLSLDRIADPDCTLRRWCRHNAFGFVGRFTEGISFAVEARVWTPTGDITPHEGAAIRVVESDELLLALAISVDLDGDGATQACSRQLDSVPMDFGTLRNAHVAEHRAIFDRVSLRLGGGGDSDLPVDARLDRVRAGGSDPGLAALYFQFGRYLLMSSSRKCEQPANLQGIWNEDLRPPWASDFHNDVNIQMNYWPAEVCSLPECAEPLFNYIERGIESGRKTAGDLYNCGGVCYCIQTDMWAKMTPESPGWDVWTGAAAWLAQHLWWRYEYAGDKAFLRKRAYPFLKEIARFYQGYLVRDAQGRLVTVPSQSPENTFVSGASPVSLCVGATMDLIFIREVMSRCLQASEVLGCDSKLRPGWQAVLDDLAPFHVGKHGQLQEWLDDLDEAEPGHRHYSHLVGVYPGDQMTPDALPEFYGAARVSLERRLAAGGGHTGWSRSWTASLWARFMDGARACDHLMHLITDFATKSLLDLHPPQIFQIDGNFGGAAAVAEMLVQSHDGHIRLLPALPPQWPEGSVAGLRARGGFVVDIDWAKGRITEARVRAEVGGQCRIAWPDALLRLTIGRGAVEADRDDSGHITFHLKRGQRAVLRSA